MLEIKSLSIKTRQPILEDFSFNFERGKLYGIVATNGSGKTTFFRALIGLIPVVAGSCLYEGKLIEEQKENFFYFENSDWLDKNLSGYDYLKFIKKEWRSQAALSEIVNYWQMQDYIKIPIKKYSLGMKQRLLIGLYQISNADFLLMDELTNGLDEASRQLLFKVLRSFVKDGKTVILSSHYKEDILPLCDYIMTIENRRMEVRSDDLLKFLVV
jgi:ABC-2 type transport system ATP-binding protein